MASYVFILCPPFSGSTILWQLIGTSDAVSLLPMEGQLIAEVKEVMRRKPWNIQTELPWKEIKAVWDRYWDQTKPFLVEKSPPHLIRANQIVEHFAPVSFLIMVRNPYAHCESLIRRRAEPARAAMFSVRCLRQQAENAQTLRHALAFRYEDLVGDAEGVCRRIRDFLPGIGELDHTRPFTSHSMDGVLTRSIVNLNERKIAKLSDDAVEAINSVLSTSTDAMNYWGYKMIAREIGGV